jgi:hypothetical protein
MVNVCRQTQRILLVPSTHATCFGRHWPSSSIQYMTYKTHNKTHINTICEISQNNPSWKTDSLSATQEICTVLRNPNFNYRVHKSPPFVSNLSHINPTHFLPSYFCKIYLNIILLSPPRNSKLSVPSSFSTKTLYVYTLLLSSVYVPKTPPISSSLILKCITEGIQLNLPELNLYF